MDGGGAGWEVGGEVGAGGGWMLELWVVEEEWRRGGEEEDGMRGHFALVV